MHMLGLENGKLSHVAGKRLWRQRVAGCEAGRWGDAGNRGGDRTWKALSARPRNVDFILRVTGSQGTVDRAPASGERNEGIGWECGARGGL